MMQIGYRAVERFSPDSNPSWDRYIEWCGLSHLNEVVGLDCSLCPSVLPDLANDDWKHLIYGEEIGDCLDDYHYLHRRIAAGFDRRRHQVLAVAREVSEADIERVCLPSGFRFKGFDLVGEGFSISALTNCGGFDQAFHNSELSCEGLVLTAERAHEIKRALATQYPEEPHALCVVWAVWRHEPT
jgi:hypothetical protein